MGIMGNFKKIAEYQRHKNLEAKFHRDVVKQSIVETTFYEKYSSFVAGLRTKLSDLLLEEGYSEVVFRPNVQENAKYFERAMEDSQFNSVYNIKRTSGGEYVFRQKTIQDKAQELGYDDLF